MEKQENKCDVSAADVEQMLTEYRKAVQRLFNSESADLINNSSPRHASILIEEMILHAKSYFYAFAGRMNPDVWNVRVMAALDAAVNRGVTVRLLVERECEPINIGIMPLSLRYAVRRCPEDLIKQEIAHCAVGDGRSLRIEMDAKTKTAVFSANNIKLATDATGMLTRMFNNSIPYAA